MVVAILVPVALSLALALPILLLLANTFNTALPGRPVSYGFENWTTAFGQRGTMDALWNTVLLGLLRTSISLPIAIVFTWLITRSDMPGRSWVEALAWLGVFVPSLPMVLGWILLLDPNFGLINTFWKSLPFADGPLVNIYSYAGIIWVHLAGSTICYKIILLTPAFRRLGAAFEEAAWVSGANQVTALLRITVPILTPAVLIVTILGFVRSLEAFEVELILGQPAKIFVYSTRIYDLFRGEPPRVGEATALGSLFLLVMVALAVGYQLFVRGRQFTTVTGSGYSTKRVRLGAWRWPAAALCFGYFVVGLAAPLAFLVLGSFMRRYGFFSIKDPFTTVHWQRLFGDNVFLPSVLNSLYIGVAVALLGVLLYALVAYVIVRSKLPTAKIVDVLAWLPWAVPGMLMSLGLLWLFLNTPLRTVLYGTLSGIVLAIVIKDSPVTTQLFKACLLQIGNDLEDCARVCGANWLKTYVRILLPLLAPAAITVGVLNFVSAIRDISTTVLLYSAQSRPLSILMLEYSFAGELERGAAIGVLITMFVMVVMLIARWLGLKVARERD